jgi:hypothetical protein
MYVFEPSCLLMFKPTYLGPHRFPLISRVLLAAVLGETDRGGRAHLHSRASMLQRQLPAELALSSRFDDGIISRLWARGYPRAHALSPFEAKRGRTILYDTIRYDTILYYTIL